MTSTAPRARRRTVPPRVTRPWITRTASCTGSRATSPRVNTTSTWLTRTGYQCNAETYSASLSRLLALVSSPLNLSQVRFLTFVLVYLLGERRWRAWWENAQADPLSARSFSSTMFTTSTAVCWDFREPLPVSRRSKTMVGKISMRSYWPRN